MAAPSSDEKPFFSIPAYHEFISPVWARHLLSLATPVSVAPTDPATSGALPPAWAGLEGLQQLGECGGLETGPALRFLLTLYLRTQPTLSRVLSQRQADRRFIDERTRACYEFNRRLGRDITDPTYRTVLGLSDAAGRIVVGPLRSDYCAAGGAQVAPIPPYLRGPHVTLFGPPDTAKMAINAMNAYHRKLQGEPAIVEQLLAELQTMEGTPVSPMWGADDEDSKTPLREDLMEAGVNLTACHAGQLAVREGAKSYALAATHRSLPIKRFPGLALPCAFLFYRQSPIPLHLYDFALHLFANYRNPQALVFYVPKLENEEEAQYLREMFLAAETLIQELDPTYQIGTIRVLVVLENPRAILRTHEIMDALYPYFAGASLGWHDYLASTARLFREDGNYRIPVKADPNIVIKYIKASHSLLAEVVGSRGGIKVGGMYGILPLDNSLGSPSFQVTLRGFFKDVITQLRRDLTGYWVAHPDFVRLGLAILVAYRRHQAGDSTSLQALTRALLSDTYRAEVDAFIAGHDVPGLDASHPGYVRSLLVADIRESDSIANHHPDEIRYNVFQILQYLTDWLSGNGCVALPTVIDGIPVRVMDDLATAERSRWEVWHEVRHGRVSVEQLLQIAHEELRFIRKDLSDGKKIVQVKYDERTAKWYPVAFRLMLQLMTAREPVEFATQLLLPFTVAAVRAADDPWQAVVAVDPQTYQIDPYVARWNYYFERCGAARFATELARRPLLDRAAGRDLVGSFSVAEIVEAAGFHGNIGESPRTLDARARQEQRRVAEGEEAQRQRLRDLGTEYQQRFGFKFLVSARGRAPDELLALLQERLGNPRAVEIEHAKAALWQIAQARIDSEPLDAVTPTLSALRQQHGIPGAQIALCVRGQPQTICLGDAVRGESAVPVDAQTWFELASLSKTVATAFAMEFFADRGIPLSASVNALFAAAGSDFRLLSAGDPAWADAVTVAHLVSHQALNRHYVHGVPADSTLPPIAATVRSAIPGRGDAIRVISAPGSRFQYSGGGFLVLEYLIEQLAGASIHELAPAFLGRLGLSHLCFDARDRDGRRPAEGYFDDGARVPAGRLLFPAFAAGAVGTAADMLAFLRHLGRAYADEAGSAAITHDTAVRMVHGRDLGCREFMGCDVGLGLFVLEAGDNRVIVHQGANEGFRAIYVYVVTGPDADTGFVALCNGDNRGVPFIAEVAQQLLRHLNIRGIDFNQFRRSFDYSQLSQEQIVNLGYKNLVFNAFQPTLPESIESQGAQHPLAALNVLRDATIVRVSNQRFARAQNLISAYEPQFDPTLFGRQGKIMDSWETARHNPLPCDELDLRLAAPRTVRYVYLSTRFHDGNQAQFVRLLGQRSPGSSGAGEWEEFLARTPMLGHSRIHIDLERARGPYAQVRVQLFPDGGLSRLGLYAEVPADWLATFRPAAQASCERFPDAVPKSHKPLTIPYEPTAAEVAQNVGRATAPIPDGGGRESLGIDWASAAYGGRLIRATNEHYGPAIQVISPFPPLHMFDGLESARSRDPGHYEEVVIALGKTIRLGRVELDYTFFVNNNPRQVQILAWVHDAWVDVAGRIEAKAFAGTRQTITLPPHVALDTAQLLVRTYPDGGINRIRVFARWGEEQGRGRAGCPTAETHSR